eukprot:TRINITY_DN38076_c0_g1_i1.p1 TRINITY_DN38076_c0_g1~~TRINITY_DN38076_c0_g1_i1.p1  ORF type:complete len:262 (+),score=44.77 TRINITY_DN38076_c0_g1_i1:60-788(+)
MAITLWLVACLHSCLGNGVPPEMMNSAVGKKPTRLAKLEPFLKCSVCKLAVGEAWSQVQKKVSGMPAGKLGEVEVGEILDLACDPDDDSGEWITSYDVVQESPSEALVLEKKESLGECRRECTTIAHACRSVFDEHREDMTEILYKHYRPLDSSEKAEKSTLTADKFISRICTKLSKACPGKGPPQGFKHRDERWMPIIDEDGYKMRKMQHVLNKAAKDGGSQPVQFLDPMGSMFGTDDEDL